MEGFILIDKPVWVSSHRVTHTIRKLTGIQRVGHAGTLDPFATGLLIVGVGRPATKHLATFLQFPKTYEVTFVLGATTPTDDSTKEPTLCPPPFPLTQKNIQLALKKFQGTIEQVPPQFSAVKQEGVKMYKAALRGKNLSVKPRVVKIYSIAQTSPIWQAANGTSLLSLSIHCSSGTYIRSIARDLGQTLETGGYVQTLRRTEIGPFPVSAAIPFENIAVEDIEAHLIPINEMLTKL
ncbi:TPA: tRNA pseudouridine(55) synthase TruB [Candidatus Uhrbacteria bacterium]|uniref:tRNA pseudouridine synthase B n=2 Tax=Candidatus Uhriibacteriota TaxID=1752732 RepID=A0A0G1SF83_9BACT|nr:MAG: tRNA pseudouridine synthase B [Candidatus Uhrbacteria bacterium GW2011_GWF2_46_218]KKU40733.1 MAG: tRNA pseudouridine synthase B [Candidatus Uhrbacteria bacterium GW2011_GWE2_46_68]HBK33583.1 tRNA pseudouridine(55) synthase TruB [Candidatus Uhrbacteria bacterium]HCB19702.1 tRNA pseudouridine(55) synthase TruB [Candidatus Uhrbacteria bacterium]